MHIYIYIYIYIYTHTCIRIYTRFKARWRQTRESGWNQNFTTPAQLLATFSSLPSAAPRLEAGHDSGSRNK